MDNEADVNFIMKDEVIYINQVEVFEKFIEICGVKTTPKLPLNAGFSAKIVNSEVAEKYINGEELINLEIEILGKNVAQKELFEAMILISENATSIENYFEFAVKITQKKAPFFDSFQDDFYIYKQSFNIFFIKTNN